MAAARVLHKLVNWLIMSHFKFGATLPNILAYCVRDTSCFTAS